MANKVSKKHLIILAAAAILCLLCGFWVGKGMYDRPVEESVSRDTVTLHDTVPEYLPAPKDSVRTKYVTRWLPRDTSSRVDHFIGANNMDHYADTSKMIAVEVPITSKHYGSKDYDAWVSGFEVSLDSIKVYKETQYITEVRTISKPPNKWELDLIGGLNYNTARQDFTPYAGGEILYKPNRLQVGVRAVVSKTANTGKFEPSVGGVVKIRVF
ncbi:MAG: hypothetical protein IKR25_08305 [Muribaculaceae bacterium]|nr:hypothetical protein [Muribaculaceae bacterium]